MEIETSRLLLRPLRGDDAFAMAQALNNLNVSRNLARVKHPYGLAEAKDFITIQRSFDSRSVVSAIAFRAAPDELIGTISYEYSEGADAIFGYWLRECCWRMGLMTEAVAALVRYAFTEGNVATLASAYHKDNPNSGRILRKIGFVEIRETMSFSLAQNTEVSSIQLRLTHDVWADKQKSRAT